MKSSFTAARKDAGRQAILDAAEACARRGTPLQMGDIAKEAGIAVGTMYRYFDDKDHLERELIARILLSIVERVERARDAEAAPEARLDAFLHAICDAVLGHLGALNLFLERSTWSQLGTDHGVIGEARQAYARFTEVEKEIVAVLKLKRVRQDTASMFLRGSLLAGLTRLAGSSAGEQRKRIEEIIRLTTQGLLGCTD